MQRGLIGVVAVLLLITGGVLAWTDVGPHEWAAACARVGLVMVALWLALPDDLRPAHFWWVGLGLLAALVFVRLPRPTKMAMVLGAPLAVWFLRRKRAG